MDQPRLPPPALLPWAATACLAALVACLGELLIVEKTRTRLLRDQNVLAEASLKGTENQLEAERVLLGRRELSRVRAPAGQSELGTEMLLLLPEGEAAAGSPGGPWGAVAWDGAGGRAVLRFSGLPRLGADRDYQVWLDGSGPGFPVDCGVFHELPEGADAAIPARLALPVAPGCRFLLFEAMKGGTRTLGEARAGGSIILATPPVSGRISGR